MLHRRRQLRSGRSDGAAGAERLRRLPARRPRPQDGRRQRLEPPWPRARDRLYAGPDPHGRIPEGGRVTRTILITGAAGNIGGKLVAHFYLAGSFLLRLLDKRAEGVIVAAVFGVYADSWAQHFRGVDSVLH